ncbi:MAG: hypothetical protein HY074_02005, partial [Deltaproteobacteria bacterium]|nr:hypothetical protein [Deltaproteobacteria bacterium]
FTAVDVPRLAQLINKSNQFNLTTARRTEAEVQALITDSAFVAFSVRLRDRFGDHGLISVFVGKIAGETLDIDTWLMSCRVLKRQVEDEVLNEAVRLARSKGCHRLLGRYLPSPKNEMVRGFYPTLGFSPLREAPDCAEYELELKAFAPRPTCLEIERIP